MRSTAITDRDSEEVPEYAGRLSPTALDTFERCPKRFEFAYVQRIEGAGPPTPRLVVGQAVHRTMAALYRLRMEQRSERAAHQLLRHFWARTPGRDEAFPSREEEARWGRRALRGLSDYCARYSLQVRPRGVESWVRAQLVRGMAVCGKTDRIDQIPGEDTLEVIDYKTGRCPLDQEDLAKEVGAQVYALGAAATFGRPVARVRFIYLMVGMERVWEPQPADLEPVREFLLELARAVASCKDFAARPSPICRWCPYLPICEAVDSEDLAAYSATARLPF